MCMYIYIYIYIYYNDKKVVSVYESEDCVVSVPPKIFRRFVLLGEAEESILIVHMIDVLLSY